MADTQTAPVTQNPDAPSPHDDADNEDSILRELNAAIAANPELRAPAPKPAEGEWEDFDRLLAENPEFAAPVAASSGRKEYYKTKTHWECGHEGEETKTDIERDPNDGTPELLINEARGICDKCMEKWVNLENAGDMELGGSSSGPVGPPTYDQAQTSDELEVEDDDEGLRPRPLFDIDDGPDKGKSHPGQNVRYDQDLDDDNEDDDRSIYSREDSLGNPIGSQPHPHRYPLLDSDDDDELAAPSIQRPGPHGYHQYADQPLGPAPDFVSDDESRAAPLNPHGPQVAPPAEGRA
ncbi:predicted protein [Uncinocarpus reesii 1704]|uniref:Uncharacterized protein n=1 Tax=Uncinocarpus reesii (strain UAMH 1704) TaxID=336963 RepID=C4JFX9_UNCRE|nr:uncharacterized protein UREG_01059 [Uncinocarpus reesii 1704]EEP76210.1 predicted protein [Uncinocarpus reesii 1704]